jgi:hypothetical protein
MLKYLCLAVLFFLNLGCTLPGPFNDVKAYYTQRLTPVSWSEDEDSLSLIYTNRSGANLEPTLFCLSVDIKSRKVTYLYGEKNVYGWRFLGVDPKRNRFTFLSNTNNESKLMWIGSEAEPEIVNLQNVDLQRPYYAFLKDDSIISPLSIPNNNEASSTPRWGRLSISNGSASVFEIQPALVTPLIYLNTFKDSVYLSSYAPGSVTQRGLPEQHAWGELDLANAEVSQVKSISEYEGYYLRFWDWLSEDEILFERQSQTDRLRNDKLSAISYRLSTQSYEVREDFRQKGLLSPTKDKVAFVEGDFLMISQPDGSHAEKILFIPRDLPKGDPEYLE